jgi:hypothetical protein
MPLSNLTLLFSRVFFHCENESAPQPSTGSIHGIFNKNKAEDEKAKQAKFILAQLETEGMGQKIVEDLFAFGDDVFEDALSPSEIALNNMRPSIKSPEIQLFSQTNTLDIEIILEEPDMSNHSNLSRMSSLITSDVADNKEPDMSNHSNLSPMSADNINAKTKTIPLISQNSSIDKLELSPKSLSFSNVLPEVGDNLKAKTESDPKRNSSLSIQNDKNNDIQPVNYLTSLTGTQMTDKGQEKNPDNTKKHFFDIKNKEDLLEQDIEFPKLPEKILEPIIQSDHQLGKRAESVVSFYSANSATSDN